MPETTKLYEFQRQGVKRIEQFSGRALLADDMGLGKTIQALWWVHNYLEKSSRTIVICPSVVKFNWQREARRHCGIMSEVLSGVTPDRHILRRGKLFIVNYDILTNRQGQESWLECLMELEPSCIIVDECQYIKNPAAKRSKAVKALCKEVPHVIMISGTPLTNRPAELFSSLNILCPDEFPSFNRFGWRYCDPKFKPWGLEFKGASNLKELHDRLNNLCMIRRRKEDVLKELPPKIRKVIPIELSPKNMAEYTKAEKDFITWLRKFSPEKARKAEKAEYLVKRGYLIRLCGTLKLKQISEWIKNELEVNGKLIFFGVHKDFLGPLFREFKKTAVLVDGSVRDRDRQNMFDSFTKSKTKNLLLGNIQAAGVGWNGQAASNVAFGELTWTPGAHAQSEDRAHRMGQTQTVVCSYLIAKGTIEEKLCDLLETKQKILNDVLDGEARSGLDIMTLLENHLLEKYG